MSKDTRKTERSEAEPLSVITQGVLEVRGIDDNVSRLRQALVKADPDGALVAKRKQLGATLAGLRRAVTDARAALASISSERPSETDEGIMDQAKRKNVAHNSVAALAPQLEAAQAAFDRADRLLARAVDGASEDLYRAEMTEAQRLEKENRRTEADQAKKIRGWKVLKNLAEAGQLGPLLNEL